MAKDYILKSGIPEDPTPAFVRRMANWAKATNEITGLIRGLLSDGKLDRSEADFLRAWIGKNSMLLYDPLISVLAARIARVYADEIVTDEELEELKLVLTKYADGENKPTTLPLDDPMPVIDASGKWFCFTGTFIAGTRSWCHNQISIRGGFPSDNVSSDLHVLVIGSKVSSGWANQTYGRKIEAAAKLRSVRKSPSIVTEEHWLKCMKAEEERIKSE